MRSVAELRVSKMGECSSRGKVRDGDARLLTMVSAPGPPVLIGLKANRLFWSFPEPLKK